MSSRLTDSKAADTKPDSRTTRRFSRRALDVHLSVHVFRAGENISFWGRSSEIGEDGIGATLTGELEPGEVVSMELSLPMAPFPIKFRALVRYRDGLRHGFEFLALSKAQRDEIRRRSRCPAPCQGASRNASAYRTGPAMPRSGARVRRSRSIRHLAQTRQ